MRLHRVILTFILIFDINAGIKNKINVDQIDKTQTKTGGGSEFNKMANVVGENCDFKKGKLCLEEFWPIRARGRGSPGLLNYSTGWPL